MRKRLRAADCEHKPDSDPRPRGAMRRRMAARPTNAEGERQRRAPNLFVDAS